jgi:hypothetical protein
MEKAFAPLLGADSPLAAFVETAVTAMSSTAGGGIAGPSVVLLLDVGLQALPWEGLSCVAPFGGRVCRDFSLHMLSHRIQVIKFLHCLYYPRANAQSFNLFVRLWPTARSLRTCLPRGTYSCRPPPLRRCRRTR